MRDKTLSFPDDIVREIRVGRHPQNTTRVVMDTEGVESYSVFTLYNPYRVIVDFRRKSAVAVASPPIPGPPVSAAVPTTGLVKAEPKPVPPPPPPPPAVVTRPR